MNERDIFLAAIEIGDSSERAAYLNRACAGSTELRAKVEGLLKSHEETSQFLETPAMATDSSVAQTLLTDSSDTDDNADAERASGEAEFRNYLELATRPGWLGRLGHYEIEAILGRGAFGIVAKAFDEKLHRVVAIKLMNPELASTSPPRKRFLREARTAAAVTHENIVAIHAVEEEPIPYLVMEYIPGMTLQQRMDEHGPLEVPDILRIGQHVASGLAAAHAVSLIHRDIKPSNILLSEGPNERGKISDFGLARALDDASLTQSGMIAGTPMYMAPEQARGETLDHRTDLFSLGSVLYQMASGRPPFRAANTVAVLKRVCEDTPRPLDDVIPETPGWLETIIFRLLEKDRDDRYQTAREVANMLACCQDELRLQGHVTCVEERVSTSDTQVVRPAKGAGAGAKKRPVGWLVGGVLAVAAVIGLVVMNGGKETPDPDLTSSSGNTTSASTTGTRANPTEATGWHGWPADAPPPAIAPFDAEQAQAHQEAWAKYLDIPVEYENSIGMKFRLIPPGEFMMGSMPEEIEAALKVAGEDEEWQERINSEAPQHKVVLTQPMYVGVTEVTQSQYEQIMGTNPSHFSTTGEGKDAVANLETGNHPVETVSWNDAAEFCAKLSQQEQLKPFYFRSGEAITPLDGTGYRLPKEAEWEYACRAGTTTRFWSGDADQDLIPVGWFVSNSGGRTHASGELKANPFGLSDVHGNVWEWVQDRWDPAFYGKFEENAVVDPFSPFRAGSQRVLRGGYRLLNPSLCRSSIRHATHPSTRNLNFGFRVVMPVDAVKQQLGVKQTPDPDATGPAANTTSASTTGTPANPTAATTWQGWPADAPPPAIAPFDAAQAKAHQEAWADYLGVPVEKEISLGQDKNGKDVTLTMVLIPPGEFMIGATDQEQVKWLSAAKAEHPNANVVVFATISMEDQRFVRITKPFWLSKLEFTTGQFRRFVENTDYRTDAETNGKGATRPAAGKPFEHLPGLNWDNWGKISVDSGPVVNVSWNDAAKCCEWLSSQHSDMAFSLPTEAQWEFACRAGTKSSLYDCESSEELREYAQFGDEVHFIQRGGQLRPNAFGLYDMLGNVTEWCSNWLAGYAASQTDDPAGPSVPGKYEMRAIRGGSFMHKIWKVRSSKRDFYVPDDCFFDRGFRVAAAISDEAIPVKSQASAAAADHAADKKLFQSPADAPPPAIAPFDSEQAKAHQ